MSDPFNLIRFVAAQEGTFETALSEIRSGRKTSHWIWYIFPQLKCLGRSQTAQEFGISNIDEAAAYLAHPILGPRLIEISEALLTHSGAAPETILGRTDALKLRSSATLFAATPAAPSVFQDVLKAFYHNTPCPLTNAEIA